MVDDSSSDESVVAALVTTPSECPAGVSGGIVIVPARGRWMLQFATNRNSMEYKLNRTK